jgi:hypothetical protein
VINPGKSFKALAKNQISGQVLSTPAFVDGSIFLRTDTALLRIQGSKTP